MNSSNDREINDDAFFLIFCFLFISGVGMAICIIDIYMGMYYNTIIGWAVYYFFASFTSELPWEHCGNSWNTNSCLTVDVRLNQTNLTSPAQEYFE